MRAASKLGNAPSIWQVTLLSGATRSSLPSKQGVCILLRLVRHFSKELCSSPFERAKAQNIPNAGTARRWNRASNLNPPPNPLQQSLILNHFSPPPPHTLGLQRVRAPFIHNTQHTPHLPTSCIPNPTTKIFRPRVIYFLPFKLRIKPISSF